MGRLKNHIDKNLNLTYLCQTGPVTAIIKLLSFSNSEVGFLFLESTVYIRYRVKVSS